MRVPGLTARGIFFWILFPFVIPQAIRVRRNAPRLSGASGPTYGSVGSGRNIRLAVIGDSIIAGVGAETVADALPGQVAAELAQVLESEISWSAHGLIGATASIVSRRLVPMLPNEQFDVVVVSVGVNDVTSLRTMRQWSTDLDHLLDELQVHSPEAMIALVGLPPLSSFPLLPQPLRSVMGIRARMFDEAAKSEVCRRRSAVHVPIDIDPAPEQFSPDGFHPSPSSYKELGRQVAAAVFSRLHRTDRPARGT
ncbi:MAG: SGNH/GDSL hydrolase family protein [Desulfomonilaceae bacterium]|nr:SGNH/GDSL hydrolase family protein [Desulfomonilaceae bacterium]